MTVSSKNHALKNGFQMLDRKSAKQSMLKRMLRMESFERRELMASDFQNPVFSADVDGDYSITPLDALIVINRINATGGGSLAGLAGPTNGKDYVDVNGDNTLSPLDVLQVVNTINRGEGTGELVDVRYRIFSANADGTPGAEILDGKVGTNQKIVVRVEMKDLRTSPLPKGIFSAYSDLNYTNADNSTAEKLQVQWGEYNLLNVGNTVASGTFKLQYVFKDANNNDVVQTTDPIAFGFSSGLYDPAITAANVQSAIEKLPGIGAGNVRVSQNARLDGTDATFFNLDIWYVNAKARQNIPDPVIVQNQLLDGSNIANITTKIRAKANPAPTDEEVLRAAFNNAPNVTPTPFTFYSNGPSGREIDTGATRSLVGVGGFSTVTNPLPTAQAVKYYPIVDTLFYASAAGDVILGGGITPLTTGSAGQSLGISQFGNQDSYLTASQVSFQSLTLHILDRLTAVTDSVTVAEDAATTNINVVNNDIDNVGGTSKTVTAVTQPSQGGTVTISSTSGNVTFTPTPDFFGAVTFTYTVKNNLNDTAVGTVSINVTPVNDPPVVIKNAFTTNEDTNLSIGVNEVFSTGPANENNQTMTLLSVSPITGQTNGTVSIVNGGIQFVPTPNFFGTAVFTAVGQDNGAPLASTTATITVTVAPVNDAPVPFTGTLSVAEDNPLILIGTGATTDIIKSSSPGPLETNQTVSLVTIDATTSQGGTITSSNGVTTYRPKANFFGTDTFAYTITDNATPALTATATLTINVSSVNDSPVAVDDTGSAKLFAIGLPTTATTLDVMANDNAGPLEPTDTIHIVPFTSSTTSLGGTIALNADRTKVIYNPPASSINKTDTFSYTIEDAGGLRASANVEVFIFPPVLPYAVDDLVTINEDAAAPTTIDVLSNDLINSGATRSLVSFGQPAAGTGTVTLDNAGTPADTSDDKLVYVAPPNYFGTTSFVYQLNDSAPNSKQVSGTVGVIVREVNDTPVATPITVDGTEDIVLTIQSSTVTTGLSKGPGEDAQTLTITGASLITSGSGTVALTNGNIVFSPAKDFNGTVLVSYTVTDNGTTAGVADPKSSTSTITINVAAVNDNPIAVSDSGRTAENVPVTLTSSSLLSNDSAGPANESGQSISIVPFVGTQSTSAGGTVTLSGSDFIYTPKPSFNGVDTFTYQITDNGSPALTATGTVTITVTEVNDAPVPVTLSRSVYASVATPFDLTADLAAMARGPANESGQTLKITKITQPSGAKGTAVLNANGTITYTAPLGATGVDTFTYEVTDNGTTNGVNDFKTATGTFNVTILPFIPSSIAGTVYIDDDSSGALNPNELRVGGIEVTLEIPADPNIPGSVKSTKTELTKVDGTYSFGLLPPGTYTVTYAIPILATDAPGANTFTRTIVAPGNVQAVYDFGILGVTPGYANLIENLASSFYATNQGLRTEGIYAIVNANGKSEWTVTRDGFVGDTFQEVVLSTDGTKAYVTAVRGPNHDIFTATVEKRNFVKVLDSNGNGLIRILATSDQLAWQKVDPNALPTNVKSNGYLKAVDDFFVGEGWGHVLK